MLERTPQPAVADVRGVDEQTTPNSGLADAPDERNVHLLFVTGRPAALEFMVASGQQQSPRVVVHGVPLSAPAVWSVADAIVVDAVVIDVADCPDEAINVCRVLQQQRPNVPVLALLCCIRPTLPAHVRGMLALGVRSFVDTRLEPRALFETIGSLGASRAIYVRLHDRGWMLESSTDEVRSQETPAPDQLPQLQHRVLIGLVARGLTNQEIGKLVHLASSTVHHQVGELCTRLGLANRVALAGWAGAHGYLRPVGQHPD